MIQLRDFSDARLEGHCVYCGNKPDTRDHVPSKVLLDEPYPVNLPIVPACNNCNQGFSKDEEYFACLLECILRGSTDIDKLKSAKIRRILTAKPYLKAKLNEAKLKLNGQTFFKTEENRIRNVILKLARGHASFENGGLFLQEPSLLRIQSISNMNEIEKTKYFTLNMKLLPEVGIRALQRLIINEEIISEGWTVVQENKYMYSISQDYMNLCVKFLICNYLACEVIWDLTLI